MLIAPVVNNSGKKGCGVLWRHKYYGKCAAQAQENERERKKEKEREREGAGGTERGRSKERRGEMANSLREREMI